MRTTPLRQEPSCLHSDDLKDRVVVLDTKTEVIENSSERLSTEMKEGNQRLSAQIEAVSAEIKAVSAEIKAENDKLSTKIEEVNDKLRHFIDFCRFTSSILQKVDSSEIKKVNNSFVPIYVFLALFTTATGMANFKDLAAFLK